MPDTNYDWISRWEGCVEHLYLDSRGFCTIGLGFLVQSSEACRQLGLVDRLTLAPAHDIEKTNEYAKVVKLAPGHPASWYSQATHLILPESDIHDLFRQKEATFLKGLIGLYPQYKSLPAPVQLALFDMAWNLGIQGLSHFHHMHDAIIASDWNQTALQCHRSTCRDSRNQATADLFTSAI